MNRGSGVYDSIDKDGLARIAAGAGVGEAGKAGEAVAWDWRDGCCDLNDPEFLRLYGAALAKAECAVMLSQALVASGLTHEKAAARVGWTQQAITNLLTGEANPTIGRVGKALAALGYQVRMTVAPLDEDQEMGVRSRQHHAAGTRVRGRHRGPWGYSNAEKAGG